MCSCGFHHDLTEDERARFQLDTAVCTVCKKNDLFKRIQGVEDRVKLGEKVDPEVAASARSDHPGDGRRNRILFTGMEFPADGVA